MRRNVVRLPHPRSFLGAAVASLALGLGLGLGPASALAGERTINFDDDTTAPCCFSSTTPLTDRYQALGVTFSGPAPGQGGAIVNESGGFGVSGHSSPNFLGFNNATYAKPPETITFASPAHAVSIKAGQAGGGTVTVTAFDGATPVSESFRTSTPEVATLSVQAARITSVRLAFTGSFIIFDDLTWATSPVSADDSHQTRANTPIVVAPGVLANDSDPDGDPLTAALTRAPGNGTVSLNSNGSFTYTPSAGFSGSDSFGYRANDGGGNGNEATVRIQVDPPPPPPPPPPPLLPSTVSNSWSAFARFTQVRRLVVSNLVRNSTITVTCKAKGRAKGCPFRKKVRTVRAGARSVSLTRLFRKRRLRVGTKVVILVAAPGFKGKVFSYTMRRRALPRFTLRCTPPGSTRPGSCV